MKIAASIAAVGLAAGFLVAPAMALARDPSDVAAIVKITKAFADMQMHERPADIDAVAAVMADDFYFHDRTGGIMGSKDELLTALKSKDYRADSISFKPYIVRIFGSTAIAQSINRVNGAIKGKPFSNPYVLVDIFTKQDGRWVWVGSEGDKIGDKVSSQLLCNGSICKPTEAAFVIDASTAPAWRGVKASAGAARDRAEILSIAKGFVGMQVTKDKATFDWVAADMADDFYFYDHTASGMASKADILATVKAGIDAAKGGPPSFDFKSSIIRTYGSTGIATYDIAVTRTVNGKAEHKSRVIVDVFDKRNGRWVWVGAESEDVGVPISGKVLCNGTICTPNQPGFVVKP